MHVCCRPSADFHLYMDKLVTHCYFHVDIVILTMVSVLHAKRLLFVASS